MTPVLFCMDPSLTAFGWVALELASEPALLGAAVIETKPTSAAKRKKLGISVAEDDVRRAVYLRRELERLLSVYRPVAVAIEAAAGSKSAVGAKALGIAQAVAACVVDGHLNDAIGVYVTARDAGQAAGITPAQRTVGGKSAKESDAARAARKSSIARAVVERFGVEAWSHALGVPRPDVFAKKYEGAHDAAAVGLAAWERPEVAAMRRFAATLAGRP